ncbi:deoxynucleoside triphosphate triphosphohydrolase SAMHD1-like [Saccostrea echinata]|uniref:deoxynucleoside triphosphate triphosphohydrolase SAMHD1-like n=1 Tax=Saccostrea echinata TaxID=191078 RepID=UPI002A7FBD86|nr:deoxynucleoside triphosphate triphosphohydrolase SAMHD1-like [Saccostrea echinata]
MEKKLKDSLDQDEKELEMFEIQDLTFNYGNKDKNPMDKVYFFHWTKGAVKVKENEVSLMMPSTFEQIYLQLLWKGSRDEHSELKEKILKTFEHLKEYSEDNAVIIELIDTRKSGRHQK